MTDGAAASFVHHIPVRYGEVDMQGVVFNAHYMAYCDDVADRWLRSLDANFEARGWDIMLVKAVIEWQGTAGIGDTIDIAVRVSRWGNTSFDMAFTGAVGERPVFTATITYVGVKHGTKETMPPPDEFRTLLSG